MNAILITQQKSKILIMAAMLVMPVLLMLFNLQSNLRYQSLHTIDHEYWRWFTGHWVHLSWGHLWMNLGALLLLFVCFCELLKAWHWLLVCCVLPLLISAGFVVFAPQLVWYVGLSGMLHGLFVYLILLDHKLSRVLKAMFLLGLVLKLLWEQIYGALPGSTELAGGNVVVDAHLYGAIAGGLAFIAYLMIISSKKNKKSE